MIHEHYTGRNNIFNQSCTKTRLFFTEMDDVVYSQEKRQMPTLCNTLWIKTGMVIRNIMFRQIKPNISEAIENNA